MNYEQCSEYKLTRCMSMSMVIRAKNTVKQPVVSFSDSVLKAL